MSSQPESSVVPRRAAQGVPGSTPRGPQGVTFATAVMVVFQRQLRLALRNPAWVVIGLLQPILYLTLFGPLLKPLASQLGTVNAYTLFVPGLLVQLGCSGPSSRASGSSGSIATG